MLEMYLSMGDSVFKQLSHLFNGDTLYADVCTN